MNKRAMSVMVLGLGMCGAALVGGCATETRSAFPDTAQVEDNYFYGRWKSADGKKDLVVSPAADNSFALKVSDANGTRKYQGHLVRVDQQPFAELNMYQPTSSEAKKVPVFLYAHIKIEPNQFTLRPLKASWMAGAVSQIPGTQAVTMPPGTPIGGGVIVKDPDSMKMLLHKALNEPGSFDDGEVYNKVK